MTSFHLGDLLSVTTGLLVSPDLMGGVHRLLDHMTQDALFTHQLPRACQECRPALLARFPFLADIETPPEFAGKEQVDRWLAELVARYGTYFEVDPLPAEEHTRIDPLAELSMMAPHMEVLVVEVPDEGVDR